MALKRMLQVFLVLSLHGPLAAANIPSDFVLPESETAVVPQATEHFGTSPFNPPEASDTRFVVDRDTGLDTGCSFRSDGPLVFRIQVDRVIGNLDRLKQSGSIEEHANLRMPAYDVDFDAQIPNINPERDRVYFNGHLVNEMYLKGANNTWIYNDFLIPVDWINFPEDPGPGGTVQPAENTIQIDIDTANSDGEYWCTAIDWAALTIEVARPVLFVHGFASSGAKWSPFWTGKMIERGIPYSGDDLNLGLGNSYATNASAIGTRIDELKARWGIDQVNIVAHSKGGIDARHYVESNDGVRRLIQLATPNAGSPLADNLQVISHVVLGFYPSLFLNALVGPAGHELSTTYMSLFYNPFHRHNANVAYHALAGDYELGCSWYDVGCHAANIWFTTLLLGDNDLVVPVRSVLSQPYISGDTYTSTSLDNSATHFKIAETEGPFNKVRTWVETPSAPAVGESVPWGLVSTRTEGGLIHDGQTAAHTVVVDEGVPFIVSVFYRDGDLGISATSPSGDQIMVNDPTEGVLISDEEFLGGRLGVLGVATPEPGLWTLEVTGISIADPAGEPYAFTGWLENPQIGMTVSIEPEAASPGEMLQFTAKPANASPILGASITGEVRLPDNSLASVFLMDDGQGADAVAEDGVYTADYTGTTQPGLYRILVSAEGQAPGPLFQREGILLATVASSNTSVQGTFQDYGRDSNDNGLYDELIVQVPVNVTAAGTYRVVGTIEDTQGNSLEASVESTLAFGSHLLPLSLSGEALFNNRVDGPFSLTSLRLAEVSPSLISPLEVLTNTHVTSAYPYTVFEHGPIRLAGTGSGVGIDLDANNLYDILRIEIGVEVDNPGTYYWSARLVDLEEAEIGVAFGNAYFAAGENNLVLEYSGESIGQHGVDGPYEVGDLLLYGAGHSLILNTAFVTEPFQAREFEGYVAPDTSPPDVAVTVFPESAWPPNHQMIEIMPDVVVVDDYDPQPEVNLESIVSNEGEDVLGDGATSLDIVVDESGTMFLRAERSGLGAGRVYTITYSARDAAGNVGYGSAEFRIAHDQKDKITTQKGRMSVRIAPVRGEEGSRWLIRWASSQSLGLHGVRLELLDSHTDGGVRMQSLGKVSGGAGAYTFETSGPLGEDASIRVRGQGPGGTVVEEVVSFPSVESSPSELRSNQSFEVVGIGKRSFKIRFALRNTNEVAISVFNVRGALSRTLVTEQLGPGEHEVVWDGSGNDGRRLPAGVYFVRVVTPEVTQTGKMVLMP